MTEKKGMSAVHAKVSAEPTRKLSPELLAQKLKTEYTANELTILIFKLTNHDERKTG